MDKEITKIPMKEQRKRRLLILLMLGIVVGLTALFLYNVSFNPSFSAVDLVSSASKKNHQATDEAATEVVSDWNYTLEDLALAEPESYEEILLTANGKEYHVLVNDDTEKNDHLILLSDKEDISYQRTVQNVADALEKQGYQITIKAYSKTMMLSMAHAGRFDIFLMSEEEQQ